MMVGGMGHSTDSAGCRILLVEDDENDADLLNWAMRRQGVPYSLDRVATLNDCLEACRRTMFDVVLLDLSLPDVDMFDGVERISALVPDLAIIVLTGLDDPEMAAKAIQAGAQDYLTKKLDATQLFESIRAAMARARH
jgi:DNA-binding response OmpR family regulator